MSRNVLLMMISFEDASCYDAESVPCVPAIICMSIDVVVDLMIVLRLRAVLLFLLKLVNNGIKGVLK